MKVVEVISKEDFQKMLDFAVENGYSIEELKNKLMFKCSQSSINKELREIYGNNDDKANDIIQTQSWSSYEEDQ